MAIGTFTAYVGIYPSLEAAEDDYAGIKELFAEDRMADAYDAAVVERRADGKVRIGKRHEAPTRAGGVLGGGFGLATGVVVALFPFAAVGGGLLAATTAGGAALGAVAGHAAAGMSRSDLKDLGEHLDAGQAGLVVVAVSGAGPRVEAAMRKAEKVETRTLDVDPDDLEQDAVQPAGTPSGEAST